MTQQLAIRLRERIIDGSYPPGSPLLQDAIAAEFGVSKIPVREALVHLQAEGLVAAFSHRGFQVRPLLESELEEAFALRLQLEPSAVGAGALAATDEERALAHAILKRFNAALSVNELAESGDMNRELHLALVVPRMQPLAAEILGRLHTVSQRYIRLHLTPRGHTRRAAKEHTMMFEAWRAGKESEARRLTREHIEKTRDELLQYLRGAWQQRLPASSVAGG